MGPDMLGAAAITAEKLAKASEWCLFWQFDWELTCMPRGEWASWNQALAGVVALLVAVGLPLWQRRLQRLAEYHADVAQLTRAISGPLCIASELDDRLRANQIPSGLPSDDLGKALLAFREVWVPGSSGPYLDSLARIRVDAIPTGVAVSCVLALREAFSRAVLHLESALTQFDLSMAATDLAKAKAALNEASGATNALRQELVRATHPDLGVEKYPYFWPSWVRELLR